METVNSEQVGSSILSTLMKSLHEGVLIVNNLNVIEGNNEAALKILGIAPNTALAGKHIHDVNTETPAIRELFNFLANQKANTAADITNLEKGYTHNGTYSIRSFREGSNGDLMKIIVLHDIRTTNKTAETIMAHTRSLEKSNSELDQFAHIVSHDLKAPLRAISNLSLWLEEDLGTSLTGENRDNFVKLRSRVVRMESLINGILEYSRVGREQVSNERVDVYTLLTELVELLSPPAHIKIHLSEGMPALDTAKVMLSQVFSNLISNAIKYNNKAEGVIKIYGSEKETEFEFVVEDNGPGIPPEYHEKIFQIFQTLQARDKFESTGIGLTIVRRILTAKGGDIRVVSAPGEGSKFIFTWPK
jgi:signal transduction histidine kinase